MAELEIKALKFSEKQCERNNSDKKQNYSDKKGGKTDKSQNWKNK